MAKTAEEVKARARGLGFDVVGVADARAPWDAGDHLRRFVELARHGDMDWMETTLERRAHPTAMWPEARSAVMVGVNYGPADDPLARLERPRDAAISAYAQGADYHDLLKKRLKQLARWFAEETGEDVKVFVDTAPLMEKPLAQRAGLGWRGKHTNLISRERGSWLFLGAMLTTAELTSDEAETDHCGSCQACLTICPTDAFPAPYELDARRCLAYLSIEHKGPIPREFRAAMGNRVYGCDDCLAVCPWNKFAQTARETSLQARPELTAARLVDLAQLDDVSFRTVFAGTAVKRIGRARFLRNVAIALGNTGETALARDVARLLDDESPLVRGAAVWALWRLTSAEDFAAQHDALADREPDAMVREEWRLCAQSAGLEPGAEA